MRHIRKCFFLLQIKEKKRGIIPRSKVRVSNSINQCLRPLEKCLRYMSPKRPITECITKATFKRPGHFSCLLLWSLKSRLIVQARILFVFPQRQRGPNLIDELQIEKFLYPCSTATRTIMKYSSYRPVLTHLNLSSPFPVQHCIGHVPFLNFSFMVKQASKVKLQSYVRVINHLISSESISLIFLRRHITQPLMEVEIPFCSRYIFTFCCCCIPSI